MKTVSLGLNEGTGRSIHAPSRGSRGESIPCFFQLLVAIRIPWLVVTSLQSLPPWSYCLLLFSVSNFPPPPSYEDTCDYI